MLAMSISNAIPADPDQVIIYVLGNRMIADRLNQFATELDTHLEGVMPIVYLDVDEGDGNTITERYEVESEQIPAILICERDETVYQSWFGQDLPEVEQVAYTLGEITGNSEA